MFLSPRQEQCQRYWAALFPELDPLSDAIKIPNIYASHYRDFQLTGITGCFLRASQRVRPPVVGAAFVMRGSAQIYLHSLQAEQVAIENELGEKLYWYEGITTETQGYVGLKACDVSDETDWSDQHQWFVTKFEKFVEVFRPCKYTSWTKGESYADQKRVFIF